MQRYWVEVAEAPFRSRLLRDKLRFSRDVSNWEKQASARGKTSAAIRSEEEDHDRRVYHQRVIRDDSGVGSGDGSETNEAAFFAFPLMMHNSQAHHVVSLGLQTAASH